MNLQQWFQKLAVLSPAGVEQGPEADSEALAAPESSGHREPIAEQAAADTLLLSVAQSAMACEFEVLMNQHQHPQGAERAMEALEVVSQLERLLSVYKPRSELSVLNRFGGARPISISHDTLTLLELARDLHKLTAGAFDITAARLSEIWGFSRREGSVPTQEAIAAALQQVGGQYVQTNAGDRTAHFLREGVQVNPGGIGKGYALDRAVGRLIDHGIENFMIHGGLSSVAARGDRQHSATGGGWLVAVKHPWRWEEKIGTARLRNQALGTSGSGKQFFHFGGVRYSHIIDPRSGWPAQGMMSATVICPSGAVADALATAFFVMGPELSHRFCDQHPQIAAILIYSDSKSGRQHIDTCNMTDGMWQAGNA